MSRKKSSRNWREVSEFDFTVYHKEDVRKCNEDFKEFLLDGLLRCSLETMPDSETRVALTEKFTEDYFAHFGQHMHSVNLYYLSNFCMLDFIKNKSYNKTATQENGFLSPRQLYGRCAKEPALTTVALDYHSNRSVHSHIISKKRNTKPRNINK